MNFSIYSFLMAVLWSSIFILLLYLCRRNRTMVVCFGVWPILGVIVCTVARCFFPLEMLSFTRVIIGNDFVTAVDAFLNTPIAGLGATPFQIAGLVWGIGSLTFFTRFLWSYGKFRKLLADFVPVGEDDGSPYTEARAVAEQTGVTRFTVYMTSVVRSPAVTGFFQPIVLFPLYPYSSEDYQNALEHEFTHWKNRDIWVKLLIELLRDIFWWNPLVYLLKYDLNQALELKCDLSVAQKRDLEERIDYVRTLEKTVCFADKKGGNFFEMFVISELTRENKKKLLQRVDVILNYEHHPKRVALAVVFTSLVMAALMVFSYSFVIQPNYEAPKEEIEEQTSEGRYIEYSAENSYLLENPDGSYSIIHNGKDTGSIMKESAQILMGNGYKVRKS